MDRDPNDDDPNDPLPPVVPGGADPLLTRVAGRLLRAHRADPAHPGRCAYSRCRRPYPCDTARLAGEAMDQAQHWCGAEQSVPTAPGPEAALGQEVALGQEAAEAGLIGASAGDGAP